MRLSSKAHDLEFLTSEFRDMKFELFTSDEALFMSCIACWCHTSKEVIDNWRALQSLVSIYFQPPGNHAKWNIYLAIFCSEELAIRDKYVIQNDRYAARKIVLDGLGTLPSPYEAEQILNDELLGADLKLKEMADHVKQEVDLSVGSLVRGAPLDTASGSKEKRVAMINNIIEFLKLNENQKG